MNQDSTGHRFILFNRQIKTKVCETIWCLLKLNRLAVKIIKSFFTITSKVRRKIICGVTQYGINARPEWHNSRENVRSCRTLSTQFWF